MGRSFGSGLLTSWCIYACTWWQYSFYDHCDSATDGESRLYGFNMKEYDTHSYDRARTEFGYCGVSKPG